MSHQTENAAASIEAQPSIPLPASNRSPSFLDYLAVTVRYWRMIAVTTVIAAAAAVGYSLTLPNIYTATAMILPSEDDKVSVGAMMSQLGGGLASLAGGAGLGGGTKADLYVSMLKSETVKDPLVDRFKLKEAFKVDYRSDVYELLDAKASIYAGKTDGIISIAVSDKNPKLAADMANAYVEELGRFVVKLNMTGAGKGRQFLESKLATAKTDLARASEELQTFQAQNKILNVTEQAKASIEGIAKLKSQLAVQEVQLVELQRRFTDTSQEVKRGMGAIDTLKVQIARLEGGGGNSSIPSVGSMTRVGQDYLRLMREFKVQEAMVEVLTKQYEMARISESKDTPPFQLLQKAKVPERKSKPRRSAIVINVTVLACLFSVLIAFIRDHLSRMPQHKLQKLKSVFYGSYR